MSASICADQLGRLADVAGHRAELLDLRRRRRRGRRRAGPSQCGECERVELGEEVRVGAVGDDEVGLVAGDRLDVGLVRRQVGAHGGRLRREVGQAVDGDDLVAGADGEEHLGVRSATATRCAPARRRGASVDGASLVDAGGRTSCRRRRSPPSSRRPPAASVAAESSSSSSPPHAAASRRGERWPTRIVFVTDSSNRAGGQESGAVSANRPCLEGLVVARRARRPDSSPSAWGLHRCGSVPGSHRTSLGPATGGTLASDPSVTPRRTLRPKTPAPTASAQRRRSWSSTPATARARARPPSA